MHPSNIPSLFSSALYTQSANPNQTPSSSHSSAINNQINNQNNGGDSDPSSAQSSASNSRANSPVSANHFSNNKGPFHQPSSRASAASSSSSAAAAQAARMFQSISLNSNPPNSMSLSPTQLTSSSSAGRMKSEGENENGDEIMEDASEQGSNKRRLHLSPAAGFTTLKLKRKLRKNTREKQRRSEINERFDRLSDLLHLTNPSANSKVEKFTVLSEAYNTIETLRKETAMLKAEKTDLKLEIHKLNNLINHLTLLAPTAINAMTELDALRAINLNLASNTSSTTPGMGVRMLGGVMSPLVSPRAPTMAIAHPAPHAGGLVGANGGPTPVAMATVVSADPSSAGAFFNASPPSSSRPLYPASQRPIAKPMTPAISATVPQYRVNRANTLPNAAPPYSSMNLNHAGHNPPVLNLQAASQTSSPNNIMRANVVNANQTNGNSSMETQNSHNQNSVNSGNTTITLNPPIPMTKNLLPAQPPLMSSTAQSASAFSASSSTASIVTSAPSMPTMNSMAPVTSPPLVYNSLSSPPTSTSTLGVGVGMGLNMNLLHAHRPSVSDRGDFTQRRDSITSAIMVADRRRSLAERRNSFNFTSFTGMSTIGTLPSLTERRPSLSAVFDRRGSITAGLMNAPSALQQALADKDAQQNNPSSSAAAATSSSTASASASSSNTLHVKGLHPHVRDGSTAPLNVLLGNLPQVDQIDTLPAMPTLDHLHQNDQTDIFFPPVNMDDESLQLNSFQ